MISPLAIVAGILAVGVLLTLKLLVLEIRTRKSSLSYDNPLVYAQDHVTSIESTVRITALGYIAVVLGVLMYCVTIGTFVDQLRSL